MFWYGSQGPGIVGSIVMSLVMLAFLGAIVALAVFAVRAAFRGTSAGDAGSDAKRILDDRLARGEIDADEYRTRLDVLAAQR
jgi:putative membrane protein